MSMFKALCSGQSSIAKCFKLFCLVQNFSLFNSRMLKSVQHNPGVFSVKPDQLRPLEKWIMKIEGQIMDGLIFDVCLMYCMGCALITIFACVVLCRLHWYVRCIFIAFHCCFGLVLKTRKSGM